MLDNESARATTRPSELPSTAAAPLLDSPERDEAVTASQDHTPVSPQTALPPPDDAADPTAKDDAQAEKPNPALWQPESYRKPRSYSNASSNWGYFSSIDWGFICICFLFLSMLGMAVLKMLGVQVTGVFSTINTKLAEAQKGAGDNYPDAPYVSSTPTRLQYVPAPSMPTLSPSPSAPPPSTDTAYPEPGTHQAEAYDHRTENAFLDARQNPLSTFGIDVDTASYANVRRHLTSGQLPPVGAVRLEEMINYFPYTYRTPDASTGDAPFATNVEIAGCPWNSLHRLVRIGIKGREITMNERAGANFVFLIDVSGSMNEANKLPLLKDSLCLMVSNLNVADRVAIVVYAGNAGLVLPSTSCENKESILAAIGRLSAGGSTAGGAGIQLAYKVAEENYIKGGVNRVILATDGDFNVGVSSNAGLVGMIKEKAKTGVFLTVLGFGMGNYQDSKMQQLADSGNGNAAYIDTILEANKALVEEAAGTLITIAKDVKIQVEFNPAKVSGYRLIGYEKRVMAKEDFNDDTKDGGEIGSGHTITALYEVVPAGQQIPYTTPPVDALKYQPKDVQQTQSAEPLLPARSAATSGTDELLTVKLRYKTPDGSKSEKLEVPVRDEGRTLGQATSDFKFASSVALFGMLLQNSKFANDASFATVRELAEGNIGTDPYRAEYLTLVSTAASLKGRR